MACAVALCLLVGVLVLGTILAQRAEADRKKRDAEAKLAESERKKREAEAAAEHERAWWANARKCLFGSVVHNLRALEAGDTRFRAALLEFRQELAALVVREPPAPPEPVERDRSEKPPAPPKPVERVNVPSTARRKAQIRGGRKRRRRRRRW
jgi:hypothetical protein